MVKIKETVDAKKELQQQKINNKRAQHEEKRKARIEQVLTYKFNKLADNPKATIKALSKNDGRLVVKIGGPKNTLEFFTTIFGLAAKDAEHVTETDIKSNAGYRRYSERLKEEGYEIEFEDHDPGCAKACKARIVFWVGVTTCFATFYPISAVVFGTVTAFWGAAHALTLSRANFTIKEIDNNDIQADTDTKPIPTIK